MNSRSAWLVHGFLLAAALEHNGLLAAFAGLEPWFRSKFPKLLDRRRYPPPAAKTGST